MAQRLSKSQVSAVQPAPARQSRPAVSTHEPAGGLAPRYLLAPEAYFDPAWHHREMRDLFGRVWTWAGIASDVAAPGQYITAQAGHHPLVTVRGHDGVLRAFHNICRHRGAVLLEGCGEAGRSITCFYHRWRYGLDGALRSAPSAEKFSDLDRRQLGLKPASAAVWNGLLFVHPDPEPAESLEAWLAPLADCYGQWRPERLREGRRLIHRVEANWKFFVENHIDGYHLAHLHAKSIKGLDHAKQTWRRAGPHWSFYEPEIRDASGARRAGPMAARPKIEGVDESRLGSSVYLVFPNLAIAASDAYFACMSIAPKGPEACEIAARVFVAPQSSDPSMNVEDGSNAEGDLLSGQSVSVAPSNPGGDFVGEDVYAAQALQRAIRSSRFEVGPLARDLEDAIPFFQQTLLDFLDETT